MRKRVATKDFVRRLRGSVSQNLILDLVRTSSGPRSHLVKIAASQNPARRGFGKALLLGLLLLLLLLLLSLLVLLLLGKARFFGQRTKRFVKGLEAARKKPKASEDDLKKESRSDQRCAMGKWMKGLVGMKLNSPQKPQDCNVDHIQVCMLEMPWNLVCHAEDDRSDCSNRRKMIDVWRKRCAMRLAQVLVNAVGSRRGSYRNQTNPCPESWQENGACAAELVTFLIWTEGSCFAVNACVPMAVAHFQHGFITKGDGIKYVVRNGTDTFYIFCLPNQRWCGTSVPIGFGPYFPSVAMQRWFFLLYLLAFKRIAAHQQNAIIFTTSRS